MSVINRLAVRTQRILRNNTKFLSSVAHPKKVDAAVKLLDRIQHFVWNKYPNKALAFFHKELSSGRVPVRQRSDLYEAVIRLFVQHGHRHEAESVLHRLETSEHILSAPLYATVTVHEYMTGKISADVFLNKIEKIVSSPSYGESSFIGLLSHLYRVDCSAEVMDQVSERYIRSQTLGPKGVSAIIRLLMKKGELSRTARWFDYHSERVCSGSTEITAEDATPYTTYMEELLSMTKESKPQAVYGPIMKKMLDDGVWPDIRYLNTAIEAETQRGNTKIALHLYRLICSFSYRGLLPTDLTYSHLFSGFLRDYIKGMPSGGHSTTPRELFFDMMIVQKLGSAQGRLPVATSVSLGSALLTFVRMKDFAAACCTLRSLQKFNCPFPEMIERKVITMLVYQSEFCLQLEAQGPRTAWVIAFLGLGSETRRRHFRNASQKDIQKRILDIGRHNAPESPDSVSEDGPALGGSRPSLREKKINRMRRNKLDSIFTLLSRASSASFATENTPLDTVRKSTVRAYEDAKETMYPSEAQAYQSKFAECLSSTESPRGT